MIEHSSNLKYHNTFVKIHALISGDVSVHVKSSGEDITVYESATTWAVGTENVTVTHIFYTNTTLPFHLSYYLQSADLSPRRRVCGYLIENSKCAGTSGVYCVGCAINGTGDIAITAKIMLPVMNAALNQTTMVYDFPPGDHVKNVPIQLFTISGTLIAQRYTYCSMHIISCSIECFFQF